MYLKFAFSIYILLLFGQCFSSDIKEEDGVLVLQKTNFDDSLKNNDYILVEFYAPWCGHCKALAPEYAKAATELSKTNPNIKLAKVDATQETELAEKYGVRGYPTLKFFKQGESIEYTGGRKSDEIINWLMKKTGPPAVQLNSVEDTKQFIDQHQVAIVGYFKDEESDNAKKFLGVASALDEPSFGIASDPAVLSEYSIDDDKIILYKKFDDGQAVFTGSLEDPNVLTKFINSESLPVIVEFNHDTAQKIFGGDVKSHLIFFLSKKAGHFETYLESIKPIAKEVKSELMSVLINSDEPDHERILEFFGLAENEIPTMRVIRLEDEMTKYKPDKAEPLAENVKEFVDDYLAGKLKEHLLQQPLPEDWDKEPVKILVASNFDEVVFDKEKDVLVEFYAPWCGHCKALAPIYDKLGEAFKDKEDIVIAKIDATANELEHTKIVNYPTLKLYTKKDKAGIQYNGDRTLAGITKFIESGGEYGRGVPEKEEEEEEEEEVPKKDEL